MPIIQVENGYIYKINSKNKKHGKAKFLFLLFLCVVLIFCGCLFLFSNVNMTSLFGLNNYSVYDGNRFFAVSLESGESFSSASENSNYVKLQDGAGYVYGKNGKYFLLAGIYKTQTDAQKVCDKISSYDAEVVEIKFDKLVLNSTYSSEQIKALRYGIAMVDRFFETMQNITICLDRGEILDAEARQKLQIFKETCQQDKETMSNTFKDSSDYFVTYVKIFHSEVISNLSTLVVSQNLSSDLKYITISTLVSFEKLQQNVKK